MQKRLQIILLSCVALVFSISAKAADILPIQTFYIPYPEEQVHESLVNLNTRILNGFENSDTVVSIVSISSGFGGTILVYDQHEDGYEADITNPIQATTEIWGDGDLANGVAPGFPDDLLDAGDIVVLDNHVDVPRNVADIKFDGGDKFITSRPVAVTRAAWLTSPGTVLAGAIEVYPTEQWGTSYELPAGENTIDYGLDSLGVFEYTTATIMAQEDNTIVDIDLDADGVVDITQILNQGDAYIIPADEDVLVGAEVVADKPIQLDMITGCIGAIWESRWYALFPRDQWSNEHYNPTSTRLTETEDPTVVYVYNPNDSEITINWETQSAVQPSVAVAAGAIAQIPLPTAGPDGIANGEGSRFFSDSLFQAITAIDVNPDTNDNPNSSSDEQNRDYDWGFVLIPDSSLTTQVLIGWAPAVEPGSSPRSGRLGSPVWITPTADTTISVDFDNDGTVDQTIDLERLERAKIFDTSDNDMTGALIFTTDGTSIAASWGQDPEESFRTSPYLDLGTTVPPFPEFSATKDVELVEDLNGDGVLNPGEMLIYKISINNDSRSTLSNVVVSDIVPQGTAYEPNTTLIDDVTPIPDDGDGDGFPLDIDGGVNIGTIAANTTTVISFIVTVENGSIDPNTGDECVINMATVTTLGVIIPLEAEICLFRPEVDIIKFTNGQDANDPDGTDVPQIAPGAAVTWTYDVENTGNVGIAANQMTVTDNIPDVNPVFDSVKVGNDDEILDPGEIWTYIATGTAIDLANPPNNEDLVLVPNQCTRAGALPPSTAYTNIGTVSIPGDSDTDPSSYCNEMPEINIIKFTNGQDANDPDGPDVPQIEAGDTVTWTYDVSNDGNVSIAGNEISVTDNIPGVTPVFDSVKSGDDDDILEPGEIWTYIATGTAVDLGNAPNDQGLVLVDGVCTRAGELPPNTAYTNIGTVTIPGDSDTDPSSYCNPPTLPACECIGVEKLTLKIASWSHKRDQNETIRVRANSSSGDILFSGKVSNGKSFMVHVPADVDNIYLTVKGRYHKHETVKAVFKTDCELEAGEKRGNRYIKFKVTKVKQHSTNGEDCEPPPPCECEGVERMTLKIASWSHGRDQKERIRVRANSSSGTVLYDSFDDGNTNPGIPNRGNFSFNVPANVSKIYITVQGLHHHYETVKAAFRTDCDLKPGARSGNSYIKFKVTKVKQRTTTGEDCPVEEPSHEIYKIVAKHSGKCMDVYKGSRKHGASVKQWSCHGNSNQQWKLIPKGNYVKLIAQHSGKCLDVDYGDSHNGRHIEQNNCSDRDRQLFKLEDKGHGYYGIRSKVSNKCIDVSEASHSNGTRIIQWSCRGDGHQLWKLMPVN